MNFPRLTANQSFLGAPKEFGRRDRDDVLSTNRFSKAANLDGDLSFTNIEAAEEGRTRIEPEVNLFEGSVFAYGTVNARFSSLSLEKEFLQALEVEGLSASIPDQFKIHGGLDLDELNQSLNAQNAFLYQTLSKPENQYIARDMRWYLQDITGSDLCAILPEVEEDVMDLVEALKPLSNGKSKSYAFLGERIRGDVLVANGQSVPLVHMIDLKDPPVNDPQNLVQGADLSKLLGIVNETLLLAENFGVSDESRALNYILLYSKALYANTYSLATAATPWLLSETRIRKTRDRSGPGRYKVIFDYENESSSAIRSWYSLVDVSSCFPYEVTEYTRFISRTQ